MDFSNILKLAQIFETASDISVLNVEFASGQEPDLEFDDSFASLVRVEFTIKGRALAKLLNKQERVLPKVLEKIKSHQIINAIQNSENILQIVSPDIRRMVTKYIVIELDKKAPKLSISFAEESDLPYTAKVNPKDMSVTVEMEFDVLSE